MRWSRPTEDRENTRWLALHRADSEGVGDWRERFGAFLERYNLERYNQDRPHQALGMKVPAELYTRSPRPYRGLSELDYPFHDWTATITHCGRICYNRRKINLSQVFAGQTVGVKQVSENIWLVSFMHYDLGDFDREIPASRSARRPLGPYVARNQKTGLPRSLTERPHGRQ